MMQPDRIVVILPGGDDSLAARLRVESVRRGFRRFAVRDRRGLRLDGARGRLEVRSIAQPADLAPVLRQLGRGETVALRWSGDRVIPLETVVARPGRSGEAWVVSSNIDEVPAALGALEHGAEVIAVEIRTIQELDRLEQLIDAPRVDPLEWVAARVSRIVPVGPGDRVIVDTTRLLRPHEGLLVGSSAAFLFCVTSEAVGSDFSAPRPFRVNAGSAHSYVMLADGTTRYLAELAPGDPVLLVGPPEPPSTARVGRLKTERRPMLMIEVELGQGHPTVFVQEAETVRLLGVRRSIPVTKLRRGDRIRGVRLPPARHLGAIVQEQVEER